MGECVCTGDYRGSLFMEVIIIVGCQLQAALITGKILDFSHSELLTVQYLSYLGAGHYLPAGVAGQK